MDESSYKGGAMSRAFQFIRQEVAQPFEHCECTQVAHDDALRATANRLASCPWRPPNQSPPPISNRVHPIWLPCIIPISSTKSAMCTLLSTGPAWKVESSWLPQPFVIVEGADLSREAHAFDQPDDLALGLHEFPRGFVDWSRQVRQGSAEVGVQY